MLCSLCFSERLGRHSVWSPCDSWLKYRIDSALMLQWNSVVSRWSFSVSAMKVSSILLTRHPSHSKSCLSAGFSCLSGDLGTRQHDFSDPPVAVKKRAYGVDKYFSEGTSYWKTWWHPMTPCRKLNLHTRAFFFFFFLQSALSAEGPSYTVYGKHCDHHKPQIRHETETNLH